MVDGILSIPEPLILYVLADEPLDVYARYAVNRAKIAIENDDRNVENGYDTAAP